MLRGALLWIAGIATGAVLTAGSASAQACGWYAIGGCFQSEADADMRAEEIDAFTVDTSEVSNFNPGWYCAVEGPYETRSEAEDVQNDFIDRGIGDAYVKEGGC